MLKQGSLMVVGSGILSVGHITLEAKGWIERADKVLYLVSDPVTEYWIKRANDTAEDLSACYEGSATPDDAYNKMRDTIVWWVRQQLDVCVVFYGHPGVVVRSSHEAINVIRNGDNRSARMLPGVSSVDCLFADLNIDPADGGCQMFEASDFLAKGPTLNRTSHVILWQIGLLTPDMRKQLVQVLGTSYGTPTTIAVWHYQASQYPQLQSLKQLFTLDQLEGGFNGTLSSASLLYIFPAGWAGYSDQAGDNHVQGTSMNIGATGPDVLAASLQRLATNPDELRKFEAHPQGYVNQLIGLTQSEKDALVNGAVATATVQADPRKVTQALQPLHGGQPAASKDKPDLTAAVNLVEPSQSITALHMW